MVESVQLKEHERLEDDRHPAEYAIRGTWRHPNPSMIFVSNPRYLWRFIKRFGIILILIVVLWFFIFELLRWSI